MIPNSSDPSVDYLLKRADYYRSLMLESWGSEALQFDRLARLFEAEAQLRRGHSGPFH